MPTLDGHRKQRAGRRGHADWGGGGGGEMNCARQRRQVLYWPGGMLCLMARFFFFNSANIDQMLYLYYVLCWFGMS